MRKASVIVFALVLVCFAIFVLLGSGCASKPVEPETATPSQIQSLRMDYCKRVLAPETCRVMVKRNIFETIGACNLAFDRDGFCDLPITSTIGEMNDCALRIGRDWALPEECLRLQH